MYIPKHFRLDDEEVIYDFIEKYGFATLFSQHNGEPYATHLPLIINKSDHALYGHFARPNEQWKDVGNQQGSCGFPRSTLLYFTGKVTYKVYGEDGIKLSPKEHTYKIGSITKTFTTSLLCKAISEENISLDHSIDEYLNLPKKDYYPTIRRLVTYTSRFKGHYFEKPMIFNFLHKQNKMILVA